MCPYLSLSLQIKKKKKPADEQKIKKKNKGGCQEKEILKFKKKSSRHQLPRLLQDQEHRRVPRAQPREVGREPFIERRDPAVLRCLVEAVEHGGVERGVGFFCRYF